MSHIMKKLTTMRKSLSARVPLAAAPARDSQDTLANKALRTAREALDKAEAKFHTQAHAPLKAAKEGAGEGGSALQQSLACPCEGEQGTVARRAAYPLPPPTGPGRLCPI